MEDEKKLAGLPESARRRSATERLNRRAAPAGVSRFRHRASCRAHVSRRRFDREKRSGSRTTPARPSRRTITSLSSSESSSFDARRRACSGSRVPRPRARRPDGEDRRSGVRFVDDLRARTMAWFERENVALAAYRAAVLGPDAPAMQRGTSCTGPRSSGARSTTSTKRSSARTFRSTPCSRACSRRWRGSTAYASKRRRTCRSGTRRFARYRFFGRETAALEGAFYADLFPRENKRGGAWMQGLRTGVPPEPHLRALPLRT